MANSYNELFGLGTHSVDSALQGWWKLQETTGTQADDSSGKNRHGTISGMGSNPVTATGPNDYLPSAFDFDGTNDHIALPAGVLPASSGEAFSIVQQFRTPSSMSANGYSFGNTYTSRSYLGHSPTGAFMWRIGNQADQFGTSLSTNTWYSGGVSYAGGTGGNVRAYLNGSEESIASTATWPGQSGTFATIGSYRQLYTPQLNALWAGLISETATFSRSLTAAEHAEFSNGPEPLNTAAPTLSGTTTVGEVLSSTAGTWNSQSNGTLSYAYQWTRSDTNTGTGEADISGATSSTYTLVAGDVGKFIRCRVRASNDGGFDSAQDTNTAFSAEVSAAGAPEGSGTAPLELNAEGVGESIQSGSGTAALELDAEGVGQSITNGFGVAAFVLDATGVGERIASGTGTAPLELSAAGVGEMPAVAEAEGFGVAPLELGAAGVGEATFSGFGVAPLELGAEGVGQSVTNGSGTAPLELSAEGVGETPGLGVSEGFGIAALTLSAVGVGEATYSGFGVAPLQLSAIGVGAFAGRSSWYRLRLGDQKSIALKVKQ